MSKTYNLKNVIYFPSFNKIGGVETYCYEMALKFGSDYDITIVYKQGDPKQMQRLREVCRVIKFNEGDKIVCDVFLFGWGWDIIDSVEAKEYVQTYHADFKARGIEPCLDKRVTKRYGVAENTTLGIREHFKIEVETMYNPYTVKKPRKVLNLVSATRLTREKGWNRMLAFADALDKAGIPFQWTVYTDDPNRKSSNPSILLAPPRLDVLNFIANADYYVQLSDVEGYCYSVVEALSVGTPVIVTDFKVAHEIGIVNGKNGWILPMGMEVLPLDDIYKGLKKFKYEAPEDRWGELLAEGVSTDADLPQVAFVKAKKVYYDLELDRMVSFGEEWECLSKRATYLEDLGLVEIIGDYI